jgi:hypothetical protein
MSLFLHATFPSSDCEMTFSIVQSTTLLDAVAHILCSCKMATEFYAINSIATDLLVMLIRKQSE